MTTRKRFSTNDHFQFRLVKEIRGRQIITERDLAKPKEGRNVTQTLDPFATEQGVLQAARNYCMGSDERKGLKPGDQFLGVVVTRFTAGSFAKIVPRSIPERMKNDGPRLRREPGTTTWLYYVEPQSCKTFRVVTTADGKHLLGLPS